MHDLLGIEVEYLPNGEIKLHQKAYIEKMTERFLPDGPSSRVQANSLPYTSDFLRHLAEALSQDNSPDAALVRWGKPAPFPTPMVTPVELGSSSTVENQHEGHT